MRQDDEVGEIEVLEYPACADVLPLRAWNGWEEADGTVTATGLPAGLSDAKNHRAAGAVSGEEMQEERRKSYEEGRTRGVQEGRQAEREAQASRMAAEEAARKQQLGVLVARFSEASDRFLHAVEQEVVKLALAVAARILRREAQMDPLLLTGAVRVALGQLAASSEVRLEVPAKDASLWSETIALLPRLAVKPIVTPVEGMRLGDCVIESKAGTVDLGVRSQLAEIERGFFDRASTAAAPGENRDVRPGDEARHQPGEGAHS
jgi:flagellar assembly protein FliH